MLNRCRGVRVLCAVGLAAVFQASLAAQTLVHPAPVGKTITVTVTESRHARHGRDQDVLIAQAAGFPNDTCDVITTFRRKEI